MEKTMTDYQILVKVIKKAIDNGWKKEIISKTYGDTEPITSVDFAVRDIKKHMDLLIGNFIQYPRQMLFDHEFAKALWGTGGRISWVTTTDTHWLCADCGRKKITYKTDSPPKEFRDGVHTGCKNGKIWKKHLQEMVLCEEPLEYLKIFLENE